MIEKIDWEEFDPTSSEYRQGSLALLKAEDCSMVLVELVVDIHGMMHYRITGTQTYVVKGGIRQICFISKNA